MNLERRIGLHASPKQGAERKTLQYINLKLASIGCPTAQADEDNEFIELANALLLHHRETDRLLSEYLCPADRRLQDFLDDALPDAGVAVRLPTRTFVLDRHGQARALSLPAGGDEFRSDIIHSYRVKQGVLHNPKHDRRTTQGSFHVATGGLPIPEDKIEAPIRVFAQLLAAAFNPPSEMLRLPFTSQQEDQAEIFVSLLLRPIVSPAVPGFMPEKTMETRFFVPGSLVSNLDFVESIFGNAGDPYLPENDAGLDVDHWTGHTGCVVLAPHLIRSRKKDLGLPHVSQATDRQKRDGMCWEAEDELYNNGQAFKLTCRDQRGVILTIIADNYFGYCKKEVKTQISYAANLYGLSEEEHAGGALVYPSYDLGEEFSGHLHIRRQDHSLPNVFDLYGDIMDIHPNGYATDKRYPDIVYVSENVHFDLHNQVVSWPWQGKTNSMKLLPDRTYVRPSGYRIHLERPGGNRAWRLVGTVAEGLLCHKPCTVSGGGKSEISKPITDAILQGPVFVADFKRDFDEVADLIKRDYGDRFKDTARRDSRPILSSERSLGSVIKLLTPASREYSAAYNEWLAAIPQYIKELVFVVKRFYKPEWGDAWREHFSVDIIDGSPGNELKCDNRKLVSNYLRVGYAQDGAWRTFGLRKDFHPAAKISCEDDITASVVVPARHLDFLGPAAGSHSVKFVKNCEYRLFQRPDEAIHRGYDKQTEQDIARPDNFLSNFEPLTKPQAKDLIEDSIGFRSYTRPMQRLIRSVLEEPSPSYFVSSAHPRLVNGKPSKNPRYLQTRPDLVSPRDFYLAEIATRLQRRVPLNHPIHHSVGAVVPGRRNNPPDPAGGIRPLAVFNPVHYMELPELFMEFICSMTGKSPSTTGAGSEGAMTKGPFNALPPIIDLNNALVAYMLTRNDAFVTAAGHIGPHCRVDHDISLLIPEIWCRMSAEERDAKFLIRNGYLAKLEDMEHNGGKILASRLGYRITARFVRTFFGRLFHHPHAVITTEMLKPETQNMDIFADGLANIVETQRRVALNYFKDQSIELACPPLKALLHIMAHDSYEGKTLDAPEVRSLFNPDELRASQWYQDRLAAKQQLDVNSWTRHISYLETFLKRSSHVEEAARIGIPQRLQQAQRHLALVKDSAYLKTLDGTIGAQPL